MKAPSGLIAWSPYEGTAHDFDGSKKGTLTGTYSLAAAKVNQGWQVTDAGARVPNAAALRPANAVSVEGWVKANASPGTFRYILSKNNDSNSGSYALYTGSNGGLNFYVTVNGSFVLSPNAGTGVWNGQFHHIAGTYDGSRVRLFVDGVEVGAGTPATPAITYAPQLDNADLFIARLYSGSGLNS